MGGGRGIIEKQTSRLFGTVAWMLTTGFFFYSFLFAMVEVSMCDVIFKFGTWCKTNFVAGVKSTYTR